LNAAVKTLIFFPASTIVNNMNTWGAVPHALQELLVSTSSIQRFERGDTFRPLAQAITNSECISELNFSNCIFHDQSSVAQFRSILENKRNLTSLCLLSCRFDGGHIHENTVSSLFYFERYLYYDALNSGVVIFWRGSFREFNLRPCFGRSERAS